MVATKEEKRAANAAAQRRRRVRQLFGLPPVGRGRKWRGGLTGWPAVGQQSVDPGIGVHTMNFAWPQGQGQIPVRLPYTSAIVQTQLWYQHHCAGIHIMQQEQLRSGCRKLHVMSSWVLLCGRWRWQASVCCWQVFCSNRGKRMCGMWLWHVFHSIRGKHFRYMHFLRLWHVFHSIWGKHSGCVYCLYSRQILHHHRSK